MRFNLRPILFLSSVSKKCYDERSGIYLETNTYGRTLIEYMATKQQPPKKKMNNIVRLSLFWAILVFIVLAGLAFTSPQSNLKDVSFSDVIRRANAGEITKIEIQGNEIKVTPKGQEKPTEKSVKEAGSSIYEQGLKQDTHRGKV